MHMYTGPLLFAVGYLKDVVGSLSKYALVYVGLMGKGFWVSTYCMQVLVAGAESSTGHFRKSFKLECACRVCLQEFLTN